MDLLAGAGLILSLFFWFIIIVLPLVVVHELGHTLMAWLFKIRVVEFGVGMPPRTPLKFRAKKMLWSLNWLPLGGFAKIYGDHDALDNATSETTKKPDQAKYDYTHERLVEALDNDLPSVLENNGLQYDSDWQKFDRLVKSAKPTLANNKLLLETFEIAGEKYVFSGAAPSAEDSTYLQGKLKQLLQLISWELEGMKKTKTAFFNRGFWPKFVVLIGGVLFNYIFAWLLMFGLLNFAQIDKIYVDPKELAPLSSNFSEPTNKLNNTIRVQKDSVLEKAGIGDRDKLVSFGGTNFDTFSNFENFKQAVQDTKGTSTDVVYISNKTKEQKTVSVTPELKEDGSYKVGAVLLSQQSYKTKDFVSSFGAATEETNKAVGQVWKGLGDVFNALLPSTKDKTALESVGGPIAIAGYGSLTFDLLGINGIIYIIALVSLSLAVFNLLPLPVLDGGRIVLVAINKLTGNRNRKLEAWLINGTMILMLVLFVVIAFRDVGTVRSIFK
jgi:regulator of sigma E protease